MRASPANATSRENATSCRARDDLFLRSSCRARDRLPSLARWSRFHRALFAFVMAAGAVALARRFGLGLGEATNLTDGFPWGLWIGFDMLVGVATSAGGFTIAFAVYILGLERYKGIARAAVLTAFLGYMMAVMGLMVDLGRPWNIWHPMIYPNPRSVMFEVAWCVMLYNTVLAIEVAPEVLGAFGLRRFGDRLHKAMPVFAGLGCILSTLHQSSLGGLFLIVPGKLHAFWSTPLLPVHFFVSAISCGLAMIILENSLSHFGLRSRMESREISALGRWLGGFLILRLALQVVDWIARDVVFEGSPYELNLLIAELVIGTAIPLVLLAVAGRETPPSAKRGILPPPRTLDPTPRLFGASMLAVGGVMLNRLNVSITGLEGYQGFHYFPSWEEIAVTLALVFGGVAVFANVAPRLGILVRDAGPRMPLWDRASLAAVGAALAIAVSVAANPGSVGGPSRRTDLDSNGAATVGVAGGRRMVNLREVVVSESCAVVFPHARHTRACATCHPSLYSILPGRGRAAGSGHAGSGCATCHNDSTALSEARHPAAAEDTRSYSAFAMTRSCGSCHRVAVDSTVRIAREAGSPGPVRFPHATHAARADSCTVCHTPSIFTRPWPNPITMSAMRRGETCGRCHNGARDGRPSSALGNARHPVAAEESRSGSARQDAASAEDGSAAFGLAKCGACHTIPVRALHVYPKAADSPGPVAFSHAGHMAPTGGRCRTCHESDRLRDPWPGLTMALLYENKACARCHNGTAAFSVEACERCHQVE
jgi:c(7)-type cytochrome triheme protein